MSIIRIPVIIGEDRHLVIDLPDDVPTGPAEVVIQPQSVEAPQEMTLEEARAKLLAAGMLVTEFDIPDDVEPFTDEELEEVAKELSGGRSTLDLINEDRGLY